MKESEARPLKEQWSFLAPYFTPHRGKIFFGLFFVLTSTALDQVGPWIIKFVIDHLDSGGGFSKIWEYLAWFAAVSLISAVLLFFQRYWVIIASRKIEYTLRNHLFSTFQYQGRGFFQRNPVGDVMSRATNDLDHVRELVGPVVLHFFRMILLLAYTGFSLYLISPWIALVGLGTSIMLPLLSMKFLKLVYKNHSTNQEYLSKLNAFVQETFQSSSLIKAFGAENLFRDKFNKRSSDFRDASKQVALVTAVIWPTIALLAGVGLCVSIYVGTWLLLQDKISLGDLSAAVLFIVKVQFPLVGLGWVLSLIQRGRGSLDRIMNILDDGETLDSDLKHKPLSLQSLEIKNLSLSIKGTEYLKNLSFSIEPNKRLGIVGATGSGKTLLLESLMGVYGLNESIVLNEKPISSYTLEEYRTAFSLAPQDGFLFSESIRSNIELGISSKTTLSVEEASVLACLEIEEIPDGLEAMLGEKGINLSGGQKQRVGLARALIAGAPLLLLDDTLSALDTETENKIIQNLERLSATAVIISHRYSSVKECDEILVLHEGEIVERGKHQELLALEGRYATTWKQQIISSDLEKL